MRKTPTDVSSDKRQISANKLEALRHVIVKLFSENLFHDVGIRDICAKAGVAPKTIYKHFGNKDALLMAAIRPDIDELTSRLEAAVARDADVETRMAALGQEFVGFYLENPAIARIIFLNIPSAALVAHPDFMLSGQLSAAHRLIKEGQDAGVLRSDVDAEDLVEAMAGITMRTMFHIFSDVGPLPDPGPVADKLNRIMRPLLLA